MAAPPLPVTELIGVAGHYAELLKLFRGRIEALNLTYETLDALCGFPARYTATLLCERKSMSIYSFFTLARALALMPAFHHDERQLADLRARPDWIKWKRPGKRARPRKPQPRLRGKGRVVRVAFNLYPDLLRQAGIKGQKIWMQKVGKRRRKQIARKAIAARWHKNGAMPAV
jgi:hypothetical protein